jgi:hypothetical protein
MILRGKPANRLKEYGMMCHQQAAGSTGRKADGLESRVQAECDPFDDPRGIADLEAAIVPLLGQLEREESISYAKNFR